MGSILHRLPRATLEGLWRAFSSGRVQAPYSGLTLHEWLWGVEEELVCAELERFRTAGMSPAQIGLVLELLAGERARQQEDSDKVQMVWTGPDQDGPDVRDSGVVARELVRQASRSLLIATFSLSAGCAVFVPVWEAMERQAELDVTLVLNVDLSRKEIYGAEAVLAFSRQFWGSHWPWARRPKVFFDPRGPEHRGGGCQHAKCIVADRERVLITSANFTGPGQERNIELGALIRDERLAERVLAQFRSLIARGYLVALPVGG